MPSITDSHAAALRRLYPKVTNTGQIAGGLVVIVAVVPCILGTLCLLEACASNYSRWPRGNEATLLLASLPAVGYGLALGSCSSRVSRSAAYAVATLILAVILAFITGATLLLTVYFAFALEDAVVVAIPGALLLVEFVLCLRVAVCAGRLLALQKRVQPAFPVEAAQEVTVQKK